MFDGVMQQVRYIPGLKRNLVSLGTLDARGYTYKASGGAIRVMKGCLVIMKGCLENGLYVLQGSTVIGSGSTVQDNADKNFLLWHKRLGHVSERCLQELEKQRLLKYGKPGKMSFCEHCILGKATRLQFKRSTHTTTGVLNYVHSTYGDHLDNLHSVVASISYH